MIAQTKADKKILTFAGTNEFTNQMYTELNESGCNAARYHSALGKKEKDKAIKDFRENEVRILCSTKALNQGFDIPDAQLGIICGLDSKALAMIQRVGRLLRLSPDKTGEVVILYVKDSQEEKWLRSSIESLSNIVWCSDISSYI
jgi:superfamily II DNA or RNA helicase